ncbi:MAG: nicotinate mononucleotide-dependent phosphoribosyltransferase CobT [Nitrososphaera sp.]
MHADITSTIGRRTIARFAAENPVFVCAISYTATSEIPGLTVAGANRALIKYTSPADAEFLYYGKCKCIDAIPATPDGKPTPALITRTALRKGHIPTFVVDAGAKIKPLVPFFSLGLQPGGNISSENAMDVSAARQALQLGGLLGNELAGLSDLVVIGESIPGGTTTALAVLMALGIDAKFKVSSSMPDNPHALKNKVVASALSRSGIKPGSMNPPIEAVALLGDPMIPSVAGIAMGALAAGCKVMLAGGTQMAAVLLVLKLLGTRLRDLCIGTTSYVFNDKTSDLAGLVNEISTGVPILSCDLHLDESVKPGLRAFSQGFVKEGVGAGGASLAAMLKLNGLTGRKLMKSVEKEYELCIENRA